MESLLAVLQAAGPELAEADKAHALELSDDQAPRQRRDDVTLGVRDKLLSLRELLSGAYGAAVAASYHLSEALPENSQGLLVRGRSVAERLATVPFTAAPRHASLKLRAADLAGELGELVDDLEAALASVRKEEREAQLTLERRNRASETWQEIYLSVTHMAYGTYILAGRRDLAERIEPTQRRRAGIEEEPVPAPAPAPPLRPLRGTGRGLPEAAARAVMPEAAPVRWWAFAGPDAVRNALALCELHHKLFERSLPSASLPRLPTPAQGPGQAAHPCPMGWTGQRPR
jgi:hypothetical protein